MDRDYDNYDSQKDNIYCQLEGHYQTEHSYFCTYKQCEMSRKCCEICLDNGIHNHSLPNQYHIMNFKTFSDKICKDIDQKQKDFLKDQEAIKKEQFLWQLLKELENLSKQIKAQEYYIKEQLIMLNFSRNEFQNNYPLKYINDEEINKLLNIGSQYDCQIESLQDSLNQIQKQINKVLQNLEDFLENKPDILSSRKYEIQQIQKNDDFECNQAIISNDDKYLLYNNQNAIQVYDIKLNKSKSIFKSNNLSSFLFSCDSQYLFAGNEKGFAYGFLASNNFKQFYQQKLHQDKILKIKIFQKYIITCSRDCLIKTDFIVKSQIFQFKIQIDLLYTCFDYDDQRDILVSLSEKTIELWDCLNQSILIDYQGEFQQLQFVNNKSQLLCLNNSGNLLKYKIDYQNKILVKLDQYYYNELIGFQMCNDYNLILSFQSDFRIIDNEGRLISTIYHCLSQNGYQIKLNYSSSHSLNNIVLYKWNELHLAKALK